MACDWLVTLSKLPLTLGFGQYTRRNPPAGAPIGTDLLI